jgi:uncharacterized membrane protein
MREQAWSQSGVEAFSFFPPTTPNPLKGALTAWVTTVAERLMTND